MTGALADPGTRTVLQGVRTRARRIVVVGAVLVAVAVVAGVLAGLLAGSRRPGVPVAGGVALLSVVVGAACVIAGLLTVRTTDRWATALAAAPWWAGTMHRTAPLAFAVQVAGGPLLDLRLRRKPVPAMRALDRMGEGPVRVVRLVNGSGPPDWLVGLDGERGPELHEAWHAPSWSPFAPPHP